jgi:hypothetical protein
MHQAQNGQSREKSSVEQKPKANDSSNAPTANVEESEDESESRIGKFHIERILGVGAFSTVALARSTRESAGTGQLVALKMLEREPCMQNERMRVSWVREVEVLKVSMSFKKFTECSIFVLTRKYTKAHCSPQYCSFSFLLLDAKTS